MSSGVRRGALVALGVVVDARHVGVGGGAPRTAACHAEPVVSRDEAIRQLDTVRDSIDRTLALIKDGRDDQAFEEAKAGYLSHFEYVEIPLRVADPQLTSDAETKFAEIRGLITSRRVDGRDPVQHRRAPRAHRRRGTPA